MAREYKEVSKEEFDKFIQEYPNKLERDVTGICEPPLATYNDFTIASKWPESVVAKVDLYDGSKYHGGKTEVYRILSV